MMKQNLQNIVLAMLLMMAALQSWSQTVPGDTVFFYKTWNQMLNKTPEAVIFNPMIDAYTPYEVYIETLDEELDKSLREDYVAAALGDSIWLISSDYVKQNFKGDVKKLSGFMPVMFNDKLAYFNFLRLNAWNSSIMDFLFGASDFEGESVNVVPDIYYLDFMNHRVRRLTPEVLSELLEDYHDLQMRYEGMKDYKKHDVIEDYFFKYIDRATDDIMRPYILDLMETDGDK